MCKSSPGHTSLLVMSGLAVVMEISESLRFLLDDDLPPLEETDRSESVEPAEEKCEGELGRKTLVVDETWFELVLYQEFPQRQLSQEMIVGRMNLIVMSSSTNQELRNQGELHSVMISLLWSQSVKYFS